MTPPRLYYMPRTRSSRVLWLLEEIGAPYDLTEIRGAQRRSEEHLLRHPLGRVPALRARGRRDDVRVRGDLPPAGRSKPGRWVDRPRWLDRARTRISVGRVRGLGARGPAISLDSRTRRRGHRLPGARPLRRGGRRDAVGARWVRLARRRSLQRRRRDVRERAQGANARGLLEPWPALEAYVQRAEARPAYARAAAISDRPRG